MLRRYLKKRKTKGRDSLPDDAFVKLPDDPTRGIHRTSMGQEGKTVETSPLPKNTLVWYITSNGKNDWYIPAIVESHSLQGKEVVKYVLKVDQPESDAAAFNHEQSDQAKKVKRGLAHAPPINVIDRWNNERVPCPIKGIGSNNNLIEERSDEIISLEQARQRYGCNLGFQGVNQARAYGPEMWGITLDQLRAIIQDEAFIRAESISGVRTGIGGMTMYDVVEKIIKPKTRGKGLGYSLYINRKKPIRANVMVSHVWGDDYERFIEALLKSGSEGPFWVCAMAIYQNEDISKLTISKQLGPHPSTGPFATVLKQSSKMVAIVTPNSDIYTRLWCIYEIFTAVQLGVPVDVSFFSETMGETNETYYNAGLDNAGAIVNTKKASCTDASDIAMIVSQVTELEGGFELLNDVISWVKMNGLIQAAQVEDDMTETTSTVPFGECGTSCIQSRLNAAIAKTLINWKTSKSTDLEWETLLRNPVVNDNTSIIDKENQTYNRIESDSTEDYMECTTVGKDAPSTMLIAQLSIASKYQDSRDNSSVERDDGCEHGCGQNSIREQGLLEYMCCDVND